MKIGYARVSTREQNPSLQIDALKQAGCERIFQDVASGAKSSRPELDKLLAEKKTSITKMISLKVTDEELMNRLLKRGQESGRADDQDQDVILNRIQEYNLKTAPLEDYYEE